MSGITLGTPIARSTPPNRYTSTAMVLHWLVAVLLLVNIALGWGAGLLPNTLIRPVIETHKSIGLTVFGLVLLRILWRLSHRPPRMVPMTAFERGLAHTVHYGFYGLMLLVPLTGYLHDSAWRGAATHPLTLWGIPFPRWPDLLHAPEPARDAWHARLFAAHEYLAYAILFLLALHLAGALKHSLVDRQREFRRMLPGSD